MKTVRVLDKGSEGDQEEVLLESLVGLVESSLASSIVEFQRRLDPVAGVAKVSASNGSTVRGRRGGGQNEPIGDDLLSEVDNLVASFNDSIDERLDAPPTLQAAQQTEDDLKVSEVRRAERVKQRRSRREERRGRRATDVWARRERAIEQVSESEEGLVESVLLGVTLQELGRLGGADGRRSLKNEQSRESGSNAHKALKQNTL